MTAMVGGWGIGQQHMPGVYRSLQRTGHGAMPGTLVFKGIPGPHNYSRVSYQGYLGDHGRRIHPGPASAKSLRTCMTTVLGPKQSIYEWIWKAEFRAGRQIPDAAVCRTSLPTGGWASRGPRASPGESCRMITWCRPEGTIP